MTSANELLNDLRSLGVRLWAEGGQIHYRAAPGVIRADHTETLKRHKPEIMKLLVGGEFESEDSIPPLVANPEARPAPMTASQVMMHGVGRLITDPVAYNVVAAFRLSGALDEIALIGAMSDLQARHDSLHTSYQLADPIPGAGLQIIQPISHSILKRIDATKFPAVRRSAEAEALAYDFMFKTFDLDGEIPFRAALIREGESKHILALAFHHMVADTAAMMVTVRDLMEFYRARLETRTPMLPNLPVQMSDLALWERDFLTETRYAKRLRYWSSQIPGSKVKLPFKYALKEAPDPFGLGEQHEMVRIDSRLWAELKRKAIKESVTTRVLILSAMYSLLHEWCGESDITAGWIDANRILPEMENLVGCLARMDLLRVKFKENPSIADVIYAVRQEYINMCDNNLPLFMIDKEYFKWIPNIQINFAPPIESDRIHQQGVKGGIAITPIALETRRQMPPVHDIKLKIYEVGECADILCTYKSDMFEKVGIQNVLENLRAVLKEMPLRPEKKIKEIIDFTL